MVTALKMKCFFAGFFSKCEYIFRGQFHFCAVINQLRQTSLEQLTKTLFIKMPEAVLRNTSNQN